MEIKRGNQKEISKFNKEEWDIFHKEHNVKKTWKKRYYKITENNNIIGAVVIKLVSGVLYLDELIIKSEHRNKKIGHNVMEFVDKMAIKNKCHKMRVTTCPEIMPSALHLYKKYGFKQEGILKNDYFNKDWIILSKYINKK